MRNCFLESTLGGIDMKFQVRLNLQLLLLLSIVVSPQVSAQLLEEIVVTAQKREQNLQDVGISVTALSGAQMEALGFNTSQELIQQVPGLQMNSYNPGFTVFNLRGISQNNFQDHLEAPVAVYADDVYLGSMNALNMQMFDLAATEVLRGPQGTLFGRNATGGLIHFRSRKATEDELNGYFKASYGERDDRVFEGAVGGAFNDSVRARIAGRMQKTDGYVKAGNDFRTGLPATGRDGGENDGFVVRGNLQIDLSEKTLLDLQIQHTEDNDVGSGQYVIRFTTADRSGDPPTLLGIAEGPILTGDVHRHFSNESDVGYNREATNYTANLKHEFANDMELQYVGAYVDLEKDAKEDAAGGLFFFPAEYIVDYEQWSHELRLSGSTDRTRWLTGLYFLDVEFDGFLQSGGVGSIGDPTGLGPQFTDMDSKNWSVFGEAEFDFTDDLTLIAGFRWSEDDKEIDFVTSTLDFTNGCPGDPDRATAPPCPDGTVVFASASHLAGTPYAGDDQIDYGDWAGRLQLNYKFGDTLLYAAFNRGIKGGSWSLSDSVTPEDFLHDEETLLSYELGYKSTLLDGKARLNASVYHYDYDDYQSFSLLNVQAQITNTDATSYGGEVEFTYAPNEHWNINLGVAVIDSEIDFVPGVRPGSGVTDVNLPQAPDVSFNWLLSYNTDVAAGNLTLQFDGNWNADQFMEASSAPVSKQESYALLNARTTYAIGDWELSFWARNLLNEEFLIYNLDFAVFGFDFEMYGPPRQVGGALTYRF